MIEGTVWPVPEVRDSQVRCVKWREGKSHAVVFKSSLRYYSVA